MKINSLFLSQFGALAGPMVIVFAGTFAGLAIDNALGVSENAKKVALATREVLAISDELSRKTVFHNMLAETIADSVALNPNLDQAGFSKLVQPFLKTNPSILNVAVAKDLVVRFVYPIDANKVVLGLDYSQVPDQFASIAQMRAMQSTVFSGPIDLIQGRRGYIHRAPVFTDSSKNADGFWGLVSVVTSEEELLSVASTVVSEGFDFAASRKSEDGKQELLWGRSAVLDADPIEESILIGDQTWQISVAPRNGWNSAPKQRWLVAFLTAAVVGFLCLLAVSARKLILSRMKSWEQLADAIEVIDDGFALYGPDDRLVMCNSKYRTFYNASSHLMQPGNAFEDIIRGGVENGQYIDAIGNEEAWIEERLSRHANPNGPVEQRLDNGRWLKVYEAKMTDGSTVGFRVDITELKDAKFAAEEANAAKTEFLNTVSHEIRTPLAAIIGYTSVLRNLSVMPSYRNLKKSLEERDFREGLIEDFKELDELVEVYADRIDANGVHLINIIDDILYWSSGQRVSASFDRRPVDVGSILSAVKDQLSGMAIEAGIDLEFHTEQATVLGDRMRLTQVFVNLVGNAIKFTDNGKVTIRMASNEELVSVFVQDTGPGIPTDEFENIFHSFTQLEIGDSRKHGGCGLGLAITKDIVVRLGGDVTVKSELGSGSVFTVVLPAIEASNAITEKVA